MNKIRNVKMRKYILACLFTIVMFIFSTIVSNLIFTSLYGNSESDMKFEGLVKLGDTYDQEKGIYSFFEKTDSLSILKKVYHILINDSSYKYYEIMDNYVEYNGNYEMSPEFQAGEDSHNVGSGKISSTPLLALQLAEDVIREFDLETCILKGHCFAKEDYKILNENKIPVVLGYKYRKYFKVGDVFRFNYLGSLGLKGHVIGFFKSGTEIYKDELYYNLDKYIVIPAFNDCKLKDEMFHKILYSLKCSCYLEYRDETQLTEIEKMIDSIRKEEGYHIDFCVLNPDNQSAVRLRKNKGILESTNITCVFTVIAVMGILLFFIIRLDRRCFQIEIKEREMKESASLLKLYTKRVIRFGIEIIVNYLAVSCLYGILCSKIKERYIIQCSRCITFLLFVAIISVYISVLKCNFRKYARKYKLK